MHIIADLHLHSKYSRAVSQDMVLSIMAQWAKKKGIDLLTTGDWTHPLWLREIRKELEEAGDGVYRLRHAEPVSASPKIPKQVRDDNEKEPLFLLTVEVSSIYSQGGRVRRIHNLIFSPSFETSEKINQELLKRGVNLLSDGRPIMGISSKDLLELILGVDDRAMLIPAHCLPPDSLIHTKEGIKKIKDVQVGDFVYTHKNRAKKVTQALRRAYHGDLFHIKPWYFSLGLATTPEHPFYAMQVSTCTTKGGRCLPTPSHKRICRKKTYKTYRQEWIEAKNLTIGDILVFPRFQNTTTLQTVSLDPSGVYQKNQGYLHTGGSRGRMFPEKVTITKEFCRLIGYYLAEGYTNGRDEVAFVFHNSEQEYIREITSLMREVFGIDHYRIYRRSHYKSEEISFYSKLLVHFFQNYFYTRPPFKATTKTLPDWMLHLPTSLQAELLRGWWRGDGGYTSSVHLMNAMKVICLRLGVIPSIGADTKEHHLRRGNHRHKVREIRATSNSYVFHHLAFFEDLYGLLHDPAFATNRSKLTRRHGWIDANYIYLPIRAIEKVPYDGEVFNLEVDEDNSYVAEFAAVHNCWTPWFALYGSNSGFDSIEECFGGYSKYIYGIETGLSSDPEMNWRIPELANRSILSFSDAHSPAKMAREATVFEVSNQRLELSYDIIKEAIMLPSTKLKAPRAKILYTIEFYPEEGKYHYTGHRNCNVVQSPQETIEKGEICPVCKRRLTVGVEHRVDELAKEERGRAVVKPNQLGVAWHLDPKRIHPPYVKLVPLFEIIAESLGVSTTSIRVKDMFGDMCIAFGTELQILLKTPVSDIEKSFGPRIAEGIDKVRKGTIVVSPGYDGVFGTVKIWNNETKDVAKDDDTVLTKEKKEQLGLF